MVTFFGIRHHGPGSAQRLIKALKTLQPDCLLIEIPEDAQSALRFISDPNLKPPVALLLYAPKKLDKASYLPFAVFSPEWQALKYALQQNIHIQAIDLPIGWSVPTQQDQAFQRQYDPLGKLAELAGYEDFEKWWDVTFEEEDDDIAVFTSIQNMIRAMREGMLYDESPFTIAREAFMRKGIRKAVKNGHTNIAVVCGAWHIPALENWKSIKVGTDNARLKNLVKEKFTASWIPWSYERLSLQSGYGAGVQSPAWYDARFNYKKTLGLRWLSRASRLLRSKKMDAPPSNIYDALNLANTLSALRERPIIGLQELSEAVLTVLCKGEEKVFELIKNKLIIGDDYGKVPLNITTLAIQKDFEKSVKTARLSKERNSTDESIKELDLRKETNLLASQLLHQLDQLGIPWGTTMKGSKYQTGSFKEKWKLKWSSFYEIKLVEAGIYGNTIKEAATQKSIEDIRKSDSLADLVHIMEQSIKSDLIGILVPLTEKMKELAALTKDILLLMDALPPLVQFYKFGSQYSNETSFIKSLIEQIIPRTIIGLPSVAIGLDEESGKSLFTKIRKAQIALLLFNNPNYVSDWFNTLSYLAENNEVSPIISGLSLRSIFDQRIIVLEDVFKRFKDQQVAYQESVEYAQWLEGFLSGSGLVLLNNPDLWNIIDNWIKSLNEEAFTQMLPILRRTFSQFSPYERKRMLQLAKYGVPVKKTLFETSFNQEHIDKITPVLDNILS
ncbi:MAG: DUF5682 family protein [Bacteroidota bacterium]